MSKEIKNLSYGKIINYENFIEESLFSEELKNKIHKEKFYLIINIPGEKNAKINIFPIKTKSVKKVLVKLSEFSPELVKGISEILKEEKLDENMVHTTGLCFSSSGCYYESYFAIDDISDSRLIEIRNKFKKIHNVIDLIIKNVDIKQE
ncbi:MAG: hypothetical protein GY870_07940 [archaeon]|nr:hypothetical protein [archaeon]